MSPLHGRASGPTSVEDAYASSDLSVCAPTNRFSEHAIDPRHAYRRLRWAPEGKTAIATWGFDVEID